MDRKQNEMRRSFIAVRLEHESCEQPISCSHAHIAERPMEIGFGDRAAFASTSDFFHSDASLMCAYLSRTEPPTGEPDAGDPPVRFGGRGRPSGLSLPLTPRTIIRHGAAAAEPPPTKIRHGAAVPYSKTAFVVAGLPEPGPNRDYQVWVTSRALSSPGVLHRSMQGYEVLVVPGDVLRGARRITITLEVTGGSERMTGRPIVSDATAV